MENKAIQRKAATVGANGEVKYDTQKMENKAIQRKELLQLNVIAFYLVTKVTEIILKFLYNKKNIVK